MSTSLLRSSTKLFVLSDFALFSTALGIFRVRAFLFLPFVFCGHYSLSSCSMLFCSVLLRVSRAPFSLLSATFSCSFPGPASTQLFSWGVVFWEVCRSRIHSLLRFLGTGVFFALAVFSGHGLRNLQNSFHILISFSFFRACSYAFLSLVNLVVSAILGAHFSYSSGRFFVGLLPRFFSFWFWSY